MFDYLLDIIKYYIFKDNKEQFQRALKIIFAIIQEILRIKNE